MDINPTRTPRFHNYQSHLQTKMHACWTYLDPNIHGMLKPGGVGEKAGAEIVVEPQSFFVKGGEGPLFDGEIERAEEWAKSIKSAL